MRDKAGVDGRMSRTGNRSKMRLGGTVIGILLGWLVCGQVAGELVSHWKLDETSGVIAADSVGSNTLTLHNFSGGHWVPSVLEGGLYFAGVDEYMEITDGALAGAVPSKSSGVAGDFTMAMWVSGTNLSGRRPLVVKQTSPERGFALSLEDGVLRFEAWPEGASSASQINSTWTLPDLIYRHIAVTYDSASDTASIYYDGTFTNSMANFGGPPRGNSQDLEVGRYYWNSSSNWYFEGVLDDIRIYDHVIDPLDILGDCDGDGLADPFETDSDGDGIPDDCEDMPVQNITQGTGFATIQEAIDVAVGGDEIEVAPGTYLPTATIDFMGKAITLRSASGDPNDTILDGQGSLWHVVQCVSGEDPNTVLEGFTITGGNAVGNPVTSKRGGGMYNENSSPTVTKCIFSGNVARKYGGGICNSLSSPIIINCIFQENVSIYFGLGGGMSNLSSSPTIMNCSFIGNTADYGGGMSNSGSNPIVTNCSFFSNIAPRNGGGMRNDSSNPIVTNCTFNNNSAGGGGGMYNISSNPELKNCTFSGNSVSLDGGGIYNYDSSLTLVNCNIIGNISDDEGGGIRNTDFSFATIANSILWANSDAGGTNANAQIDNTGCCFPQVSYSNIQGWVYEGSINADPMFVNEADGDFRLLTGSPCIDSGNNDDVPVDLLVDQDGLPRIQNGIVDIGAYEFGTDCDNNGTLDYLEIDSDEDGVIDVCDLCPGYNDHIDTDNDGIPDDCDITKVHNLTQGTDYYGLQTAINAAVDGDIIEAEPETYYEAIDFLGKAITLRSESGDPNNTIIHGDGVNSVVQCLNGEDHDTILDGFTITGNDIITVWGGGMYNRESSPTVMNCIFTNNPTTEIGGGMLNDRSSPRVIDCIFDNNYAQKGGAGMCNLDGSDPIVTNCRFLNNSSEGNGAGMYNIDHSDPVVTGCHFIGNSANGGNGGGMFNAQGSYPVVTNCSFLGNVAYVGAFSGYGGGMHNYNSSVSATYDVIVRNCIFSGNVSEREGGGIYSYGTNTTITNCGFSNNVAVLGGGIANKNNSSPNMRNSIFWKNIDDSGSVTSGQIYYSSGTPVANYCLIQGGWSGSGGTGILSDDPLFIDPNGLDNVAGTEDDNLRLLPGSPCIDAGNNNVVPADLLVDLDGLPRIQNGVIDMGAYEYNSDCDNNGIPDHQEIDSDGDGMIDVCDICEGFDDFEDSDGDGVPDGCDICSYSDDNIDSDEDSVPDGCDLCPGEDDNVPAPYGGGSGTLVDPLLISEENHLETLVLRACDWDNHFRLTTDLDLTGIAMSPIGTGSAPFSGTFDGGGHSISNLSMDLPQTSHVGLFGYVDNPNEGKTIFNLGLVNPNITGYGAVGALVGGLMNGTIERCYAENGVINGHSEIGGLAGFNGWFDYYWGTMGSGTLKGCYVTGVVGDSNTFQNSGGLVGFVSLDSVVSKCQAQAEVAGVYQVGGLAGGNNGGSIQFSNASGMVNGTNYVGGFVGAVWGRGSIHSCYATGDVAGSSYVGGLSGVIEYSDAYNCYATGMVTGTGNYFGGLVGVDYGGNVYDKNFWDAEVNAELGGIGNGDDPNVIGLATGNLQMADTFVDAGWDFENTWRMCEDGVSYPRLRWEYEREGDWECPDGVFVEDLGVVADEWLLGVLGYDVWPTGRDGVVNWGDFAALLNSAWAAGPPYEIAAFANEWLKAGAVHDDVAPGGGDGVFDLFDYAKVAGNWMAGI